MVDIKYGDRVFSIKNDVNEFSIGEYEKIVYYLNNEGDFFDKWFNILEYLGLDKGVIDDIDANELIEIINSINLSKVEPKFISEIELGGYLYKCEMKESGEPKITGRIFKLLEKVCKGDYYISDIMAILFKRDDLSDAEHYQKAHLEWKSKLFKDLSASVSVPYVLYITDRYIKNIMILK
jgi:hypothetical protein